MKKLYTKNSYRLLNAASLGGLIFSALCHLTAMYVESVRFNALAKHCETGMTDFRKYREKVTETWGKRREAAILDEVISSSTLDDLLYAENAEIYDTGLGTTLCYDHYNDFGYLCDIEAIKQAVNRLNKRGGVITLNDFAREVGIVPDGYYSAGDILGWHDKIEIEYHSCNTKDGHPVFDLWYYPDFLD